MPEHRRTLVWDLWIPDAGSLGVSFGRGLMEESDTVWVHAAPTLLRVEVSTREGQRVGFGDRLAAGADSPMTRLRLRSGEVRREDTWPTDADLGQPVILPGGEVGLLRSWWNDEDRQEWRWTVELHNHR